MGFEFINCIFYFESVDGIRELVVKQGKAWDLADS